MSKRGKRPTCARPDSLLGYLRLRRGLSIQELSTATGVSMMVLWHLEQLRFNVRLGSCKSVAEYYRITLDEMINNDFSVLSRMDHRHCELSEEEYMRNQEDLHSRRLSIGRRGELLVADWERNKLASIGFDYGVDATPGLLPGKGYDVMSFTMDRKPLFIEVKTTVANKNIPFHMSGRERAFMKYCFGNIISYELHRIYDLNGIPQRVVYTPERLLRLPSVPCDYLVTPEGGESEYVYD